MQFHSLRCRHLGQSIRVSVLAGLVLTVLSFSTTVRAAGIGIQAYFAYNYTPGSVVPLSLATSAFGSPIPVGNDPYGMALSPVSPTLYVLNESSGTITVIDTLTDTVTNTFDLATEGLYHPYAEYGVVSPDGKTLYITDSEYDAYALNAQTGALEATYTLGSAVGTDVEPYAIAIGPKGGHVYVNEYTGGPSGHGALGIIDTATGTVSTLDLANLALPGVTNTIFAYPLYGLAVSPGGGTVYVSAYPYNSSTNTYGVGVAAIDLSTQTVTQFVELSPDYTTSVGEPGYLYLDPTGAWLYMPANSSSSVAQINTSTGAFQFISVPASTDPFAAAFGPGGGTLYVDGDGTGTVSEIDTNPTSSQFGQVTGTIPGPSDVHWISMGFPPISTKINPVTIEASAAPYTGSVAPDVLNLTSCSLAYKVTSYPASGDLRMTAATGAYTFTPSLGDLPSSESFTWQATPVPATCAPGSSAAGTVIFTWKPTFGSIGPFALAAGQSTGTVSFNVFSSGPITLVATSSNPAVVPPGALDLSQDCQGSCSLNFTAGSAGSSTVTLLATEPSGATASTAFAVAVSPASTSNGGSGAGGFGPWALLGLLGVFLLRRRATQA